MVGNGWGVLKGEWLGCGMALWRRLDAHSLTGQWPSLYYISSQTRENINEIL